jgi:hypothetical protein
MKNKNITIALVVVILVITVGVIGRMFAKKNQTPNQGLENIQPEYTGLEAQIHSYTAPFMQTVPTSETTNWQTYTDKRYGYEIKYPKNWEFWIETDKNLGGSVHHVEICDTIKMKNCVVVDNYYKDGAPTVMGEKFTTGVNVNGTTGMLRSGDDFAVVSFDNALWTFQVSNRFEYGIEDSKRKEITKVLDNIFATFKFISIEDPIEKPVFDDKMKNEIVNWSNYKKFDNSETSPYGPVFGIEECSNDKAMDAYKLFIKKANHDVRKFEFAKYGRYEINLFITPNYDKTKNFSRDCSGGLGAIYPIKTYEDYILWGVLACSAGAPSPGDVDFDSCEDMAKNLRNYFDLD